MAPTTKTRDRATSPGVTDSAGAAGYPPIATPTKRQPATEGAPENLPDLSRRAELIVSPEFADFLPVDHRLLRGPVTVSSRYDGPLQLTFEVTGSLYEHEFMVRELYGHLTPRHLLFVGYLQKAYLAHRRPDGLVEMVISEARAALYSGRGGKQDDLLEECLNALWGFGAKSRARDKSTDEKEIETWRIIDKYRAHLPGITGKRGRLQVWLNRDMRDSAEAGDIAFLYDPTLRALVELNEHSATLWGMLEDLDELVPEPPKVRERHLFTAPTGEPRRLKRETAVADLLGLTRGADTSDGRRKAKYIILKACRDLMAIDPRYKLSIQSRPKAGPGMWVLRYSKREERHERPKIVAPDARGKACTGRNAKRVPSGTAACTERNALPHALPANGDLLGVGEEVFLEEALRGSQEEATCSSEQGETPEPQARVSPTSTFTPLPAKDEKPLTKESVSAEAQAKDETTPLSSSNQLTEGYRRCGADEMAEAFDSDGTMRDAAGEGPVAAFCAAVCNEARSVDQNAECGHHRRSVCDGALARLGDKKGPYVLSARSPAAYLSDLARAKKEYLLTEGEVDEIARAIDDDRDDEAATASALVTPEQRQRCDFLARMSRGLNDDIDDEAESR